MNLTPQLAAARHYAPPLIVAGRLDRRGAPLRQVNRRAVDYARSAGFGVDDVYPGGMAMIRSLAPTGGLEMGEFARAAGLLPIELYSFDTFGVETPSSSSWDWRWTAIGAAVGAMLGGPMWAAAGSLLGGVR